LGPGYTFVYRPDESTIEEHLNATQEHDIHEKMLGPQYVQEIDLSFEIGAVAIDTTMTAPGDTVWTAVLTNVYFRLMGTTPDHPTVTENIEVQDGRQQFRFKKLAWSDPSSGRPIWGITRWVDLDTVEGGETWRTATHSWGEVKDMYR